MMEDTGEPKAKLLYLESLRGLAALMVVLFHTASVYFPAMVVGPPIATHSRFAHLFYTSPLGVLVSGNFAVAIFFTLSGYVLARIFFKRRDPKSLERAASKRYLRLAIPVLVSVILAYLLMKLGLFQNWAGVQLITHSPANYFQFEPSIGKAIYEGLFGTFVSGSGIYNPVLWTMQIELFGSFLVFAITALFGQNRLRWVIYLALVAAVLRTEYLGFVVGMLLADLLATADRRADLARQIRRCGWGLLATGILLGGYTTYGNPAQTTYQLLFVQGWSVVENTFFWHNLAAFFVLVAILGLPRVQKWLSWRPLVYLGQKSFSLYLLHQITLMGLSTYIFSSLIPHFGYTPSVAITVLAYLSLTLLGAHYFEIYVDRAAISISAQVANWALTGAQAPGLIAMATPLKLIKKLLSGYAKTGSAIKVRFEGML